MPEVPKFVFECQRCGECCKRDFDVYMDDIEQWVRSGTVYQMIQHLSLDGEYGSLHIALKKNDAGICPMFKTDNADDAADKDSENKDSDDGDAGTVAACTIYENRPASCRAFPLGYNGKNYIVVSKKCPGLNAGPMTPEILQAMRDSARDDFEHKSGTRMLLPMLQALFMEQFNRQSRKAYEKMSEDDRKKVEEIFSKKNTGDTEGSDD